MDRQVEARHDHRGRPHRGAEAHHHRPRTIDLFDDCDLVIEAATENEEVKREIFKTALPGAEAGRR